MAPSIADPGHRRGRRSARRSVSVDDERRDRAVERLGGQRSVSALLGSARRVVRRAPASASRIASTTASTVSSNALPSVEMIRASGAGPERRDGPVASRARRGAAARRGSPAASGARRVEAALLGPPAGPLLDRRVEEELEVRVGQHDGPDVAAGHDDRRPTAASARWRVEQRGAQLGDGATRPRPPTSTAGLRTSSVWSTPSTRTRASRPVLVGRQLDLVDQARSARPGRRPRPRGARASQVTAR